MVLRTVLGSSATSSTPGILIAFLLNGHTPVVRNPEAILLGVIALPHALANI